jgi:hypothetical protein
MSESWYETGFDGMEAEQQRLDEQQGPGRLWIPETSSKDVVFADDEPVCVHEHNPKMNGNYRNWQTCLQGVYDEVVCCQQLGPNSRYYCGYLTLVDCSEWKDQRGNKHQYELRLLQLKMKSLKKLRRKKEDKGALIGTMWKFTREDSTSPVCGDDWEFTRDVDMDKMFPFVNYRGKKLEELWAEAEEKPESMARLQRIFKIKPNDEGKLPRQIVPFNYFELLKPKAPKDMRLLLGGVQAEDDDDSKGGGRSSSNSGGGGTVKQDNVPF